MSPPPCSLRAVFDQPQIITPSHHHTWISKVSAHLLPTGELREYMRDARLEERECVFATRLQRRRLPPPLHALRPPRRPVRRCGGDREHSAIAALRHNIAVYGSALPTRQRLLARLPQRCRLPSIPRSVAPPRRPARRGALRHPRWRRRNGYATRCDIQQNHCATPSPQDGPRPARPAKDVCHLQQHTH